MSLYTKRTATDYLVIHCSATRPSQTKVDAAEIRRWHRAKGWVDIGYHYVIKRDGTVEHGRPISVVGAHVQGHNHNTIGICLVGGVSEADIRVPEMNFTQEQMDSLKELLISLKREFEGVQILGHRDFEGVNKACPSFDVKTWLRAVGLLPRKG